MPNIEKLFGEALPANKQTEINAKAQQRAQQLQQEQKDRADYDAQPFYQKGINKLKEYGNTFAGDMKTLGADIANDPMGLITKPLETLNDGLNMAVGYKPIYEAITGKQLKTDIPSEKINWGYDKKAASQELTQSAAENYDKAAEQARGAHGLTNDFLSAVPQTLEIAGLIGVNTFVPEIAPTMNNLYLGKIGAQTYGGGLHSYDQYCEENGIEPDDKVRWGVGMANAIFEVGAEGAMGGITRYMPKGMSKTVGGEWIDKLIKKDGGKLVGDVVENFARQQPKAFHILTEGLGRIGSEIGDEEFTEAGNILTDMIYKEANDRPDMEEITDRTWGAAKGAVFMSAMLHGPSVVAENYVRNRARNANGLQLVMTQDQVFEVTGMSPDGNTYQGMTADGKQVEARADEIIDQARLSNKEFKEYAKGMKQGLDMQATEQVASLRNQATGKIQMALSVNQKENEVPFYILNTHPDGTAVVMDADTGKRRMINATEINQETVTDIDEQQFFNQVRPQEQEAQETTQSATSQPAYEPGQPVAINGMMGVVSDMSSDGRMVIETPQGSIEATSDQVQPVQMITDGKNEIPSIEQEDGTMMVGEQTMDQPAAQKTADRLNQLYQGKRTFEVQSNPSGDINRPDSYQIVSKPQTEQTTQESPQAEASQPVQAISPQVESQEAAVPKKPSEPVYAINGQPVSKSYLKGIIRAADSVEDLSGVQIENDTELQGMVEAKFPQPKAAYSFDGETIDRDEAMGIIAASKSREKLQLLNIENDPELQAMIDTKFPQETQPEAGLMSQEEIDAKPVLKGVYRKPRRAAFTPESRQGQLARKEAISLRHAIMNYFIQGGRITPELFRREVSNHPGEYGPRVGLFNNEEGIDSEDTLQERMKGQTPFADVDGQEFRNTLHEVLRDHKSVGSMMNEAESLLAKGANQVVMTPEEQRAIEEAEWMAKEEYDAQRLTEELVNSYLEAEEIYTQILANEHSNTRAAQESSSNQDQHGQDNESQVRSDTGRNTGADGSVRGSGMATDQTSQPASEHSNGNDGQLRADVRPAGEHLENRIISKEVERASLQVNQQPTEGQKEAGNYKKGHVSIQGMDITIENPKGSKRSGIDKEGKPWEVEMNNAYGYFKRTEGKDGDHVDVFIGEHPTSEKVFVVDQVDEKGAFDEHKVMMGFNSKEEAAAAYNANYSQGWKGLGAITEMGVDEFKAWVKDGKRTKEPAAYHSSNADAKAFAEQSPMTDEQVSAEYQREAIEREFNTADVPPVAMNHLRARFGMHKGELGQLANWQAEKVNEAEKKIRKKLLIKETKEQASDRKMRERDEKVKRDQAAFRKEDRQNNWEAMDEEIAEGKNLSERQQANLDKQLTEIDRKIEEQKTKLSNATKNREKKYAEVNQRNGLFGDTAQDPRQQSLFAGDFVANNATLKKSLATYDSAIREAKAEIERLNIIRKGIENNGGSQSELFAKNTTSQQAITAEQVSDRKTLIETTVSEFNGKVQNPSKVVVVGRQSELAEAMKGEKAHIQKDAKKEGVIAAYYSPGTDTVYLVAENMPATREGIFEVYAHEQLLHKGLRMLLPNMVQRQIFMKQIFDVVGNEAIMEVIGKEYTLAPDSVKAEEYLAHLSEKLLNEEDLTQQEQSTWDQFIQKINDLILQVFGRKVNLTVEDLHSLIRASAQEVIGYVEITGNTRSDLHSEGSTPSQVSGASRVDVSGREDGRIGSTESSQPDVSGLERLSEQSRGQVALDGNRIGNNGRGITSGLHQEELAGSLSQAISDNIEIITVHHGTATEFPHFDDEYMGGATNEKANGEGHYFGTTRGKVKRYAGKAAAHAGLYDAYASEMAAQIGDNAAAYFKERMADQGVEDKLSQKLKAHKQSIYSQEEVDAVAEYVASHPLPHVRLLLNVNAFKNKNEGSFNHLKWNEPINENQRQAILKAAKGLKEETEIAELINNPETTGQDVVKRIGGFYSKGKLLEEGIFKGDNSEQRTRELLEKAEIDGVFVPKGEDSEGKESAYITFFDRDKLAIEEVGYFKLQPEKKNLVVLHNIAADQINQAAQNGGLIAPSIAITNINNPFTDFGDVTLIGKKQLIDPQNGDVKVFAGDVYSPSMPRPEWGVDKKTLNKWSLNIYNKAYDIHHSLKNMVDQAVGDYSRFVKDLSNTSAEGIVKDEQSNPNTNMKLAYLIEKGVEVKYIDKPQPLYILHSYDVELTPEEKAHAQEMVNAHKNDRDFYRSEEYASFVKGVVARTISEKYGELRDASEMAEKYVKNIGYSSWANLESALRGVRETDTDAMRSQINQLTDEKDYLNWYAEKVKQFQGDKYFTQGKKKLPYTSSNLLESIVGKTRGQEKLMTFGINKAKSFAHKQLKSIADIKKVENILTSKTEMTKIDEAYTAEYFALAEKLDYQYSSTWDKLDDMGRSLADYYKGKNVAAALRKNGFVGGDFDAFKDFADRLKAEPVDYFEAKMQREVGLEEFAHAVVPEGSEAIETLKAKGVNVVTYKTPEERHQAILDLSEKDDEIRFKKNPIFYSPTEKTLESIKQEKATVHAIELSPELKEKSLKPQPLFKKEWEQSGAAQAQTAGEALERLNALRGNKDNHSQISEQGKAFSSKYRQPVVTVQTTRELPANIQAKIYQGEERNIQAAVDPKTGIIYLVSQNLNPTLAEKALLHELLAHKGLREVLGDQFNHVLDKVYQSMNKADIRNFGDIYGAKLIEEKTEEDRKKNEASKRLIAEEYMAYLAESYKRPGMLQKIAAQIRDLLRKLFNINYSVNDIMHMLNKSEAFYNHQMKPDASEHSDTDSYLDAYNEWNRFKKTDVTETKAFRDWFGQSKIVDATGKPKVVYHGTGADFSVFEKAKAHDKEGRKGGVGFGKGKFYLTSDVDVANNWANNSTVRGQWSGKPEKGSKYGSGEAPNVMPLYVRVENPISEDEYFDSLQNKLNKLGDYMFGVPQNLRDKAIAELDKEVMKEGHDGIVGDHAIAVYSPNQIKSATGNNGNFDPHDPDIRYKKTGMTDTKAFIEWFDGSQVIDKEGNPLIVFHGTNEDFSEFNGFDKFNYFAEDKAYADRFRNEDGHTKEVYLSIKNPLDLTQFGTEEVHRKAFVSFLEAKVGKLRPEQIEAIGANNEKAPVWMFLREDGFAFRKAIEEAGYDGIKQIENIPGEKQGNTTWVAFESSQVKSVDNNGDFDPDNNDIRFKKTHPADLNKKGDAFIEKVQDKMISVKRLEQEVADRGGNIGEFSKIARAETLSYGKVKNAIERCSKELVDPVMKSAAEVMKAKGCTLVELQRYLKAKHAPERNRIISKRLNLNGETNQSGFETVEAEKIVDAFENGINKALIDQMWADINALSKFTLDRWLRDGFIAKDHYDVVSKMYQYYVPMKGYMDKDTTWEYLTQTYNNIVNPNQDAEGRQLESEDPLQNLVSMAQTAIIAGEKNRVNQHAYRLAANNKEMEDLFKVQKVWYVETDQQDAQGHNIIRETFEKPEQALFDAGKVTEKVNPKTQRIGITATQEKEHEVEVFLNGQKHKVIFENPAVARALNGENVVKYDFPGFQQMSSATRWMSANLTAKNPAFIPVNTMRDIAYATAAHYIKGQKGDMGRFIKNMAIAERAMQAEQKGKGGKYVDLYKQFKENGGETGFIHSKQNEELLKEIEKDVKRYSGTNSKADKAAQAALTYSSLKFWGDTMENFAVRSENLSRFATYLTAIDRGATPEQAAFEAKEITVNFNTKGTHAAGLGGMFAFFNASVQGGQNFMSMGWNHKGKFVKASATFMAMGFLTAMSQLIFKDDEEEKEWNQLSDYMKQNYLCVGYGKGKYVSIPLPPGFRAFYAMGVMVADQIWGIQKNPTQLGLNMGSVMTGAVSPIDPVSFFKAEDNGTYMIDPRPIVPTVVLPMYDVWINEDFAGRPITREPYSKEQERELADAGLYMKNVNGLAKWMTDRVYEMGGGDTSLYRSDNIDDNKYFHVGDLFDYNPSNIEHLIESYTGGRGKFFNQLQKTTFGITEAAYKAVKGEEEPMADFEPNDIPVVSRLNRKTPGANYQKIYYQLKEEVEKYRGLKKAYEEKGDYKADNEMERKAIIFDMMQKDMNEIKKLERETLYDLSTYRRNKELKDKILKPYLKLLK